MTTTTAMRHVENALRSRLGIRAPHARRIIDRRPLNSGLDELGHDVRGCIAVVGDLGGGCRGVALYHPDAEGCLRRFGELDLLPEDLVRFDAMPIEQAYSMPAGLFLPEETPNEIEDARIEPSEWISGSIVSHHVQDGHVRVTARIGDDDTTFAMIPWFGTAGELSQYVSGMIGVPSRLYIIRDSKDWSAIGFPADMPIIDMILPEQDMRTINAMFPTLPGSDLRLAA